MVCVALALVPVAIVARGSLDQSPHEEAILIEAMARLFPDDDCVLSATALELVERELQHLGSAAWTVRVQDGARGSPCNSVAVDGPNRLVLLVPASRPEVSAALTRFHVETLRTCLNRDEVAAQLDDVLEHYDVTDFETRYDGPVTFPVDPDQSLEQASEAALRHYENGCYTYSGLSWSTDGTPVYFLVGDGS